MSYFWSIADINGGADDLVDVVVVRQTRQNNCKMTKIVR